MDKTAGLQDALNTFGKMLNIALIYGMDHPSIRAPLFETHLAFESALKDAPQITVGLFNNALTVNDKMISEYTIHLRALERRLISLDIPHLVIRAGLSAEEMGLLVAALCTANSQEGQSLTEKLEEAGLSHIKTEEVEYVAQHEGEYLTGGEDGESEGGGDGTGDKDEGEGDEEEAEEPAPEPSVHVEQIVAFLKGETASSEAPSADLQEMLSDPEKLGQLIMESASVRQSVQSLDSGESLADIVIGCLRNTYEDLSGQKKFKSARGKASLNKAMLLLEKTVVDKIRNAVGDAQPEIDEQVLSALREMEEERQVDILAARYAEQQKKLTKAETDILRYAREHGEERARELLDAADVPENEWRRLMVRSRVTSFGGGSGGGGKGDGSDGGRGSGGGGTGAGSSESVDMGALAIVLDKLENIMQFDETPPALVRAIVDETRNGVADVQAQLENQIEELEEEAELLEAEEKDTLAAQTSRADLLLQISQLALKLAQPLTVVNASVEAAIQQTANLSLQKELLDLARESGVTLKELMERLTQLVGYPTLQQADVGLAE